MSRRALPPLAARPAPHPPAQARLRLARHRAPRPADELPPAPARRPPLLPLPTTADAAGGGALAGAGVRSRRQLQPLRRQVGAAAARHAARLLLLHAHALRLAHAAGVLRPR